MGDFSLKNGSIGKGIVGMLAAALLYIVIPVSIATLMMHTLDLALADISEGTIDLAIDTDVLEVIQNELLVLRDNIILFAIPIVILAFPKGFYPKGNFGRVPFGLLQTVTIALWIWYITNGGVIPVSVDVPLEIMSGFDATITVSLNLILTGFIYLFMIVALAQGASYFAEYGGNRRKYLKKKQENEDDDQEPKEKKKSKKEKKDKGEDWELV